MPVDEPRFHVTVGSRFENIELVQAVLHHALEGIGLDEDARHWIDLAVREAVANAIRHGNREDPDKRVEVEMSLDDDDLVIRVLDQGEGFEPVEVSDPLSPENRLNPDGRGIFYMKSFMDDIDYSFRPGGGTAVTLRKKVRGLPARGGGNDVTREAGFGGPEEGEEGIDEGTGDRYTGD